MRLYVDAALGAARAVSINCLIRFVIGLPEISYLVAELLFHLVRGSEEMFRSLST